MNTELPYYYDTEVVWKGGRTGVLGAAGLPSMDVAPPPEFKGHEGVWTPEHLYVAAINVCYMATFVGISANSNLEFISFNSSSNAKLEKVEGRGLVFTEVTIKPNVVIKRRQDFDRTMRILEKAEKTCLVSNSTTTRVILEPDVKVQEEIAQAGLE